MPLPMERNGFSKRLTLINRCEAVTLQTKTLVLYVTKPLFHMLPNPHVVYDKFLLVRILVSFYMNFSLFEVKNVVGFNCIRSDFILSVLLVMLAKSFVLPF